MRGRILTEAPPEPESLQSCKDVGVRGERVGLGSGEAKDGRRRTGLAVLGAFHDFRVGEARADVHAVPLVISLTAGGQILRYCLGSGYRVGDNQLAARDLRCRQEPALRLGYVLPDLSVRVHGLGVGEIDLARLGSRSVSDNEQVARLGGVGEGVPFVDVLADLSRGVQLDCVSQKNLSRSGRVRLGDRPDFSDGDSAGLLLLSEQQDGGLVNPVAREEAVLEEFISRRINFDPVVERRRVADEKRQVELPSRSHHGRKIHDDVYNVVKRQTHCNYSPSTLIVVFSI